MSVQIETAEIGTPLLDGLEQNVKRVVLHIANLREENQRLELRVRDLQARCLELEKQMEAGQKDPSSVEIKQLKIAEKTWQKERVEVAKQIDAIVEKLDALES